MMFRLACRSLMTRPIRAAVLAAGFGFGIAVMAELLGVGHVILEQAHSPALHGGGDLVVSRAVRIRAECALCDIKRAGRAGSCRSCGCRLAIQTLPCFLMTRNGPVAVSATGGIPSLERSLGDSGDRRDHSRGPMHPATTAGRGPNRAVSSARWTAFTPFPMFPRAPGRGPSGCTSTDERATDDCACM